MLVRDHQNFEWPHRPEGDYDSEELVHTNHASSLRFLQTQVFAEHAFAMIPLELEHGTLLAGGIVGYSLVRPYLAVRMRIAGSHHLAAVLENLNVANPI